MELTRLFIYLFVSISLVLAGLIDHKTRGKTF